MTERAQRLYAMADRQIAELIALLETAEEATLQRPCTGREKLGDGTIAALLGHTADNYQRIAAFFTTRERMSTVHTQPQHAHVLGQHDNQYSAENLDVDLLVQQLSDTRAALARITELSDMQLDAVPSKDSFRFCDGQRDLEQVLGGLLIHQSRQVEALVKVAIA
jgi:hypothetical protein